MTAGTVSGVGARRSRNATGVKPALASLLAAMLLVACEGGSAISVATAEPPQQQAAPAPAERQAEPGATPATTQRKMMPDRIYPPTSGEVACPSLDFEEFLRAFSNSGDLQVKYTAKPYVLKGPYYEKHNTQPGDPANPQWAVVEVSTPMHDRYRYDTYLQAYVDDTWLRPGEIWTGVDANGQHIVRPITELDVRKVSETEYAIDTPGRITTFTRRKDCWYLTHDWSLDPFEGCFWPDQCLDMREYEAPYFDDDTDPAQVEATIGTMTEVIDFPRKRRHDGSRPDQAQLNKNVELPQPGLDSDDIWERRVDVPAPIAGVIGARDDDEGRVEILDREGGEVLARFRDMSDIAVQVGDRVEYGQILGSHHNVASDPVFLKLEMESHRYPQFRRYVKDVHDGRFLPEPASGNTLESTRR